MHALGTIQHDSSSDFPDTNHWRSARTKARSCRADNIVRITHRRAGCGAMEVCRILEWLVGQSPRAR